LKTFLSREEYFFRLGENFPGGADYDLDEEEHNIESGEHFFRGCIRFRLPSFLESRFSWELPSRTDGKSMKMLHLT
jgi:hypothetical protein